MPALKREVKVDPQEYEKRWSTKMGASLEDAFNDILSNFSDNMLDEHYSSFMNQFLFNNLEEVYYFDNFIYVYPRKMKDKEHGRVLNNLRGKNQFRCVELDGKNIVIEEFQDEETVEMKFYSMTPEAEERIDKSPFHGDIGEFLLLISEEDQSAIEPLQFNGKVVVKHEHGSLMCYDSEGNIFDIVPTIADRMDQPNKNGISFYHEVEKKIDKQAIRKELERQALYREENIEQAGK